MLFAMICQYLMKKKMMMFNMTCKHHVLFVYYPMTALCESSVVACLLNV